MRRPQRALGRCRYCCPLRAAALSALSPSERMLLGTPRALRWPPHTLAAAAAALCALPCPSALAPSERLLLGFLASPAALAPAHAGRLLLQPLRAAVPFSALAPSYRLAAMAPCIVLYCIDSHTRPGRAQCAGPCGRWPLSLMPPFARCRALCSAWQRAAAAAALWPRALLQARCPGMRMAAVAAEPPG
jgi:hypothetical protein